MLSEEKQSLIDQAIKALESAGVTWRTNNGGIHLIIITPAGKRFNFWPTTQKWAIENSSSSRCIPGLTALLNEIALN